jgi:hypothetical protein
MTVDERMWNVIQANIGNPSFDLRHLSDNPCGYFHPGRDMAG